MLRGGGRRNKPVCAVTCCSCSPALQINSWRAGGCSADMVSVFPCFSSSADYCLREWTCVSRWRADAGTRSVPETLRPDAARPWLRARELSAAQVLKRLVIREAAVVLCDAMSPMEV